MTAPVTSLLILGGSGDLSSRLLLPALGQLLTEQPEREMHLVGAGTEKWSDDDWRKKVRSSFATQKASGSCVRKVLQNTAYLTADVTKVDDLTRLVKACQGTPAIYFALPPAITAKACAALKQVALPEGTVLALEKPFGTDQASAAALNALVTDLVPEEQVHRIDHFLGRSAVYNMLGLRFANRIFEPVWNAGHIERVDIRFDETLGLENRARYYDKAGALVDMIQSHLLQVLSVFAMEPPATLAAIDLRDAKAQVIRAVKVWHDRPSRFSRRARYTAGTIDGRKLPSYVQEKGVNPNLETETLAEVTVEVDNWRWAGVPFTLRSGKALGTARHEIVVSFRPAQHVPGGLTGMELPTKLRIALGPDEMVLELNINGRGDPHTIDRAELKADFGVGQLVAYGEVLEGLLDADPALTVRGDTAEECWRIVAPVLRSWHANKVPLESYPAGSDGPTDWAPLG
ncbi:MAG: glucose-6-phosphate dehydrogenase [Microbacteriaceae bacterium]